jgi:hypothetical protein
MTDENGGCARALMFLLPAPPTGLADGFGREDSPYHRPLGLRIHPKMRWVPGSFNHD